MRIGWDRSFDADLIEDRLTPERLEALQDGADPTTAEEDLWREALLDSMLDAFDAPQFDLWGWHNRKGEPQIIVSWRDDAGNADSFDGIYVSIEEVRAALLRRWDRITLWCDDEWKTKASG